MARAEGIEIEEIVLHPFGGLARMKSEPENPRAEFRIAVAGPAASFLLPFWRSAALKLQHSGSYVTQWSFFFPRLGKSTAGTVQSLAGLPT